MARVKPLGIDCFPPDPDRSGEENIGTEHELITKSDTTVYNPPFTRLYVGGAGNIAIVDSRGNNVLYTAIPVGSQLQVPGARQIMSTNTTATLIVGMR